MTLHPYSPANFTCDNCQREFSGALAYSEAENWEEFAEECTYCEDCVLAETCSFVEGKKACLQPIFNQQKQLCRSHNHQVRKRFNEFTKEMSVASTAAWEMQWEQSGDWQYFWSLGSETGREIRRKPTLRRTSQPIPKTLKFDQRITGRTRQLNLKVTAETYQLLQELSIQEKCLMTEIVERALLGYIGRKSKS